MRERLDVSGLTLTLELPADVRPADAPVVDMGVAPGLSLTLAEAWQGAQVEVQAVCVGGDAWFWAPGLEGAVLGAASAIARKTLGLATLDPGSIRPGPPFEQSYSGEGVTGRHWLGFSADQLVLCSASCRGEAQACRGVDADAAMTSEAVPEPGAFLSAATHLAAQPRATAACVAAVAIVVAGVVLWRRPRPE